MEKAIKNLNFLSVGILNLLLLNLFFGPVTLASTTLEDNNAKIMPAPNKIVSQTTYDQMPDGQTKVKIQNPNIIPEYKKPSFLDNASRLAASIILNLNLIFFIALLTAFLALRKRIPQFLAKIKGPLFSAKARYSYLKFIFNKHLKKYWETKYWETRSSNGSPNDLFLTKHRKIY